MLLVRVKVLLASFLLVLLPLVLAQATLSQVNDDDCCSNELCTRYSRGSTRCSWCSARPGRHLNRECFHFNKRKAGESTATEFKLNNTDVPVWNDREKINVGLSKSCLIIPLPM